MEQVSNYKHTSQLTSNVYVLHFTSTKKSRWWSTLSLSLNPTIAITAVAIIFKTLKCVWIRKLWQVRRKKGIIHNPLFGYNCEGTKGMGLQRIHFPFYRNEPNPTKLFGYNYKGLVKITQQIFSI